MRVQRAQELNTTDSALFPFLIHMQLTYFFEPNNGNVMFQDVICAIKQTQSSSVTKMLRSLMQWWKPQKC